MVNKCGIDVSNARGMVNWSAVKNAGMEYAIIRAGYGREITQKDEQFENNYAGCKSNGIPVGAYYYSYATSVDEARLEAQICLQIIAGKTFDYPIYFDIEEPEQRDLGMETISAMCVAFCSEIEKAGYFAGIYSFKSFLEDCVSVNVRKRYAVWVAHWGVPQTTYNSPYGMWQRLRDARCDGVNGDVDINTCYVDYPSIIKAKGLNGFAKAKNVVVGRKQYTTYSVVKGDTLWGISEKYLGAGNRYNEIMVASGIKSETIYEGQVLKIPRV